MPQPVSTGSTIGGYRVEEPIGRGGMGIVYRATHIALRKPVALKLITEELAEDEGFQERFRREPQLAASIDHPNVIQVFDAGEDDGRLFVAMRLIDGTDLGAEIAREGRLDPERAARIVSQVAEGLDAAHELNLVHRDVKPANILLENRRGKEYVYLTDFGLTKSGESVGGVTKTGQWLGTPDYVAPEQIEGRELDPRADVYALGAVLYHALAGKPPYGSESEVAKIYAHLSKPLPPLDDVSPELVATIQRAMAKDPADRYPTAGEFGREALAAATGKGEVSNQTRAFAAATVPAGGKPTKAATPASHATEPGATSRISRTAAQAREKLGGRRGAIAVGAVIAVAAIGAGAVLLLGSGGGGNSGGGSTASLQLSTDTVSLAREIGSDTNQLSSAVNSGSDTSGMVATFRQAETKAGDLGNRVNGDLAADAPGRDGLTAGAKGLESAASDLAEVAASGGSTATAGAAESARGNVDSAFTGLEQALTDLRSSFAAEGSTSDEAAVSDSIKQLDSSRSQLAAPFDGLIAAVNGGSGTSSTSGQKASDLGQSCGNGVAVGPATSCPFALNVAAKFRATGQTQVTAFSPARSRNYVMNCSPGTPTVCRGGKNATVYID